MPKKPVWALVANGTRARILKGLENPVAASSEEMVSGLQSTHLQDIMSDKSGRSFASDKSGRRSAMEPGSDPVRRDMQNFARLILNRLEDDLRRGELAGLAIFASPTMLGILRDEMPPDLRDAVISEKPLNLMPLPEAELRDVVKEKLESKD